MNYNTYCDNEELKKIILCNKPISKGLFSHEIAMLVYASYGSFKTTCQSFSGTWKFFWKVEYPELLFASLVSRGFIRECTDDEVLNSCRINDLHYLLKAKNEKSGNTKSSTFNKVKLLYDGATAAEILGFRYYILSQKGREALHGFPLDNKYQNIVEPLLQHWKAQSGALNDYQINMIDATDATLEISTQNYQGDLYLSANPSMKINFSSSHEFHSPIKITILCGNITLQVTNISRIFLLPNIKKIIIIKYDSIETTLCSCFNLEFGELDFEEKIPKQKLLNASSPQRDLWEIFVDSDLGIFENKSINYFISPNDEISELLINTYFADNYSIKKLPHLITNDTSANYCISVPLNDVEIQRFIMYLAITQKISPPKLMGVRFFEILQILFRQSEFRTIKSIMDNESMNNSSALEASNALLLKFNYNIKKICKQLKATFPSRSLLSDPFHNYTSNNKYQRDPNYQYTYDNLEKYKTLYDSIILMLKENGTIKTKWLSEFSLYLLVKSYYSDTIYQYRSNWLGLQSLDIFIPSLNLAIEYQGEQHFHPVDLFGGAEQFQITQERDKRKRELCIQNNIKLIFWNYEESIDNSTLYAKLLSADIQLTNPKVFPQIEQTTPIASSPRQSTIKNYIYQYDKDYNLVRAFQSIAEASKIVGVGKTSIGKAINGERFLAGGYFWHRGEVPLQKPLDSWIEYAEKYL